MYVLSLSIRRWQKARIMQALLALVALIAVSGQPALAESPPVPAGPVKLVVLGDSLTAGYRLPKGSAFPEQLQWRLNKDGHQVRVINAGVSGDTTAGGLARLSWSVPKGTYAVIVELGANDALRGINPQQTYKNLDRLIRRLKARNIRILLAGMEAPRNLGRKFVRSFGRIYPDLAKKHKLALYPFFLKGVALQRSLLLKDGLHPNEKGVAVMVENILPHVERLIAR